MSRVDERKRKALSDLVRRSGVSENSVMRVIDVMKNMDAVGLALLLEMGKDEPVMGEEIDTGTTEEDATFEDGAKEE